MKRATIEGLVLAALILPAVARADDPSVTGMVHWAGPPRTAATVPVTQDPSVCGTNKPDESLLVDKAGGVRNVVVSLVGVAGAPKPVPVSARLDQKTCQFSPHVQAVPIGSTLMVGNEDPVLHNVHGYRGDNTLFNLAMPTQKQVVKRKLPNLGLNSFRCDAGHVWMSAYIWTFDHPYFAVTDGAGHFVIPNVPPGNYTLHAWHEGWKRKDGTPTSVNTIPVVVERPVKVEAGHATEVKLDLN